MIPHQEEYCPLWKRGLRLVRRRIPHLLALLLLLGYWKYTQLQTAHQQVIAARVNSGQLAVDDAQVLSVVQSAVPPLGDTVGKTVIAAGMFFGGLALVWFILSFIAPVLPAWAKGRYPQHGDFKQTFLHLSDEWKFRVYQSSFFGLLAFWAICCVAASLIK